MDNQTAKLKSAIIDKDAEIERLRGLLSSGAFPAQSDGATKKISDLEESARAARREILALKEEKSSLLKKIARLEDSLGGRP